MVSLAELIFVTAFSQSDASVGLVLGSFFGLVITIVFISDTSCYEFQRLYGVYSGRIQGNGTCDPDPYFCLDIEGHDRQLGASVFVSAIVKSSAGGLMNFLPAIIFVIGAVIAFATGTSWGPLVS